MLDDTSIDDRYRKAEAEMGYDVKGGGIFEWLLNFFAGLKQSETEKAIEEKTYNRAISAQQEESIKTAQDKAAATTQLPFIQGANNKSALGNSIPYLIGKMYNTPLKLSDGFYTLGGTNGTEQYYHVAMCCGFGKQNITKVMLGDDVILEDADGLADGEYSFKVNGEENENNTIEIRQNGSEFSNDKYKYKVVATQDGSEVKHDYGADSEPLIRQLPDYTQKVEICIQLPALRTYDSSSGSYGERTLEVIPYWSNDDGENWNAFSFDGFTDNKISLNVNHTIRFLATKEFTAEECYGKKIKIKIDKVTPKEESNTDETTYLAFYQCYCYDNKLSTSTELVQCSNITDDLVNKTARIGISIQATANTKDYLDEFHVIGEMFARTWNGSAWTTEKTPTNNPAAEILEIRQSEIHTHSQYTDDEIDLESLGALYEYCESNGYEVNALLTSGVKKSELINNILACCNATEYFDSTTGKLAYAIDQKQSTPAGIINAENVLNIQYSKDMSRKADGLKVSFTSEENWQVDTFYAMMNGGDKSDDDTITEYNLDYVTKYEHAYKLAQRKLRQIALQPRVFSATMGREARKFKLYDTVYVQCPAFFQGLASSTIINLVYNSSGKIKGLELSDYIQFESDKRYGILINAVSANGSQIYSREITGTGKTRKVTFTKTISGTILPQMFNLVSIGYLTSSGAFTTVCDVMKITSIEPNGDGYTVELKDYNESMYEYGTIPEYKSNITRPPRPSSEIPDLSQKGLNGDSGFNTRTITLYTRSEAQPEDLPATFTQYYAHNEIDATTTQLNGWSVELPTVREDNAPMWSITQTKVSQSDRVYFNNTDWSTPVKVSQDVEVTKAEIQDMIKDLQDTAAPSVYASCTFASIAVDLNSLTTLEQSFSTTLHVLQAGEEIDFEYDTIEVPDGWTVSHVGNVVTFTVAKGTFVKNGNIEIKIKYRAFVSLTNYGDETTDGVYSDESGVVYGTNILSDDYTLYTLGFGYAQIQGGRYFNSISDISKIPTELVIGDYFTYTGETVTSELSEDTKFYKSAVYVWNGTYWKKSDDTRNLMPALSDVLSVANDELETNNSEVVELFNRIVSHDIIAETLTVTGKAFMNKIIAKTVASQTFIAYGDALDEKAQGYASTAKSEAISSAASDATEKANTAKSEAISSAAADATTKANKAQSNAETNAAADATSKANSAKAAAISTAASDATAKANAAQAAAEATASADATTKAKNAQTAAESTAAADATAKATQAKLDAISGTLKDLGFTEDDDVTIISGGKILTKFIKTDEIVIGNLSGYSDLKKEVDSKASDTDAQSYATKAQENAEKNASTDATKKADSAKTAAISTAASDATTKANNARSNAASDVYNATGLNALTDKTIISGGHIKTDLIDASKINVGKDNLDSTVIDNGKIKTDLITVGTDNLDSTVIENGKIKTDLIQVSSIDITDLDGYDTLKQDVDDKAASDDLDNVVNGTTEIKANINTGSATDTGVAIKGGDWTDENSDTGFGILKNGDAYFNNGQFRGILGKRIKLVEVSSPEESIEFNLPYENIESKFYNAKIFAYQTNDYDEYIEEDTFLVADLNFHLGKYEDINDIICDGIIYSDKLTMTIARDTEKLTYYPKFIYSLDFMSIKKCIIYANIQLIQNLIN